MEYRLGEPERGKTLFEGIVDSHAKRWDLWSIYVDMEVGQNDIQSMRLGYSSTAFFYPLVLTDHHHIRNIFDRILAQKMTSHKAKYVFTSGHKVITRSQCGRYTLLGRSSRNGLHWRKESGMRQVLRRSKQRLSNGLDGLQYTQQQQKVMSEVVKRPMPSLHWAVSRSSSTAGSVYTAPIYN